VNVAVAQVGAVPLDTGANARRTVAAIADAAARGAGIVVLPELVATGYEPDDDRIEQAAEPGDGSGPVLSAWRAAAAEHGVAVIGGFCERDGDRLFNAVAVIDRAGALLGVYRKLHLFGSENRRFAPGDLGLRTFDLDGVKVGVLVCYDLRFPEALRALALEGADLIAVPTAWVAAFDRAPPADGESIGQVDGVLVQANLSQVYVACADLVGERVLGRSVIASPYGEPLAGPLSATEEDLAVADVDPDEARRAQVRGEGISPRQDRRTDVYELTTAGSGAGGDALLADIERRRGYVLDIHRTLARLDPQFLAAYDDFLDASFLRERSLDRRTKELVYVGALMALDTPPAHLAAHMRAAVDNGATEQEVLEVLEQVLPPAGVPRFIEALATFESTFPDWRPA
jgi:predicted amidohydrolase/alkylhydroperoxidase/carboxymuconolactone decarboxylase family protein YurZ